MINRIVASVKYNTIYTCAKCGGRGVGDTRHIEVDTDSAEALADHINSQRQTSYYMPVGWAYSGEFHCEACK